eukprot:scaffold2481_cov83-Skeletonema_dohrnii-CCMP3373.AAC.6
MPQLQQPMNIVFSYAPALHTLINLLFSESEHITMKITLTLPFLFSLPAMASADNKLRRRLPEKSTSDKSTYVNGRVRHRQTAISESDATGISGKSDRRLSIKSSPWEALATQAKEAPRRHADLERVLVAHRKTKHLQRSDDLEKVVRVPAALPVIQEAETWWLRQVVPRPRHK